MTIFNNKLNALNYNEITLIILFLYIGVSFFSVAIANIFMGIAVASFLIGVLQKQINLKSACWKSYIIIAAPFFLTVLSFLNSGDIDKGFRYIFLRLPLLFIPYIILCLKIDKEHIKKAFRIFVYLCLAASFITFYNAIRYFNEDILFKTDFVFFITIIQHPYFGVYILLALMATFEFNLFKSNVVKTGLLVVFSFAISLTTSRIVYISYLFVVILYLNRLLPLKKVIGSIFILGIVASIFIFSAQGITNKFKRTFDYEQSPRLKLWSNSLEVFKTSDSYLFGIGIGDFYHDKKDVYFGENYGDKTVGVWGYNPHSQPIEFLITNGVFGILILSCCFLLYLKKLMDKNTFAKTVFLIIFLFSLTECILDRQYGVQLYCVLMPLLLNKSFKRT